MAWYCRHYATEECSAGFRMRFGFTRYRLDQAERVRQAGARVGDVLTNLAPAAVQRGGSYRTRAVRPQQARQPG